MIGPHPAVTEIKAKVEPRGILDDLGGRLVWESLSFIHFRILHRQIIADCHLTWQHLEERADLSGRYPNLPFVIIEAMSLIGQNRSSSA